MPSFWFIYKGWCVDCQYYYSILSHHFFTKFRILLGFTEDWCQRTKTFSFSTYFIVLNVKKLIFELLAVQVCSRPYHAWCIWNCWVMDDHKELESKKTDSCNDALFKWTSCKVILATFSFSFLSHFSINILLPIIRNWTVNYSWKLNLWEKERLFCLLVLETWTCVDVDFQLLLAFPSCSYLKFLKHPVGLLSPVHVMWYANGFS